VDDLNTIMLSGVEEYRIVDPQTSQVIVYIFSDHYTSDYSFLQGRCIRFPGPCRAACGGSSHLWPL